MLFPSTPIRAGTAAGRSHSMMHRIRSRIIAGFATLFLFVVVVSAGNLIAQQILERGYFSYKTLADEATLAGRIQSSALESQMALMQHLLYRDEQSLTDFRDQAGSLLVFAKQLLAVENNADRKRQIDAILEVAGAYQNAADLVAAQADLAGGAEAKQQMMLRQKFTGEDLSSKVDTLRLMLKSDQDQIGARIDRETSQLSLFSLAGTAFVLLFGIVLAIMIARRITRPVVNMVNSLKDISEGEGDLTRQLVVASRDELGELGSYFNRFVGRLHDIIARLKEVVERNNHVTDDLSSRSAEISSALVQVAATVGSVAGNVASLDRMIQSARGEIGEIRNQTAVVANNVDTQSTSVAQSSAAIQEMIASIGSMSATAESRQETIEGLIALAGRGAEAMRETRESTKEIEHATGSVSELIALIRNVADQTNMLAMNAAIEAAHAGEYGKGFAVVADEIGSLAAATGKNVREITGNLKEISVGVERNASAIAHTDTVLHEITASIQEVAQSMAELVRGLIELGAGSTEITSAVSQLTGTTDSLRDSTHSIAEKAATVGSAIDSISTFSAENSAALVEVRQGISEVASAGEYLSALSVENADISDAIERELGSFKTGDSTTRPDTPTVR